MKKVKMAVIGLGSMGRGHLRKISGIDDIDLVAVCDINEKLLQKAADEYGCQRG